MITLTDLDLWVLDCWRKLDAYRGRTPTVREVAAYCDKRVEATRQALTRLELAGKLARDERGRFVRPRPRA
jgi:predicted transcriptional regulator of viral defense system